MHAALILLGFWALAFVTLCLALLLLNIYSQFIGYDFTLHSAGKEALVAGICSLIVPALLVFVIYMLAHLEDWNRFDPGLVLLVQFAIAAIAVALLGGNFGAALIIAVVLAGALAVIGSIAKGL